MKTGATINTTQQRLKKSEVTAPELVQENFKKIEKNKDLNAFLTVTEDEAYESAKKQDFVTDKPLSGVTFSAKDLFLTKGIRTTAGSKLLEAYIPPYSSTVVKRMQEAGGILVGKTNCDAWAHGASGENSDYGPTLNAWNKKYVPGGSSSGSAVAVAAGLSLVSLGTDTGGSIRQPASFCGVVGLKPTYGAVSRYGIIAMASSLDCPGVFASDVEGVKTVFKVIRGPDGLDSTVTEFNASQKKEKLTIGLPQEFFGEGLDKEVEKTINEATRIFKKEGIEIVDISLPHTKYAIDAYYIIQPAEVSSNLSRYDGVRYGDKRTTFGEEAKRRIMLGTYVLSAGYYDAYYLKAQKVRSVLIAELDSSFKKVDAILAPVSPTAAFKLGQKINYPLKMYLSDIYTVSANLAGIPAISLPFGFNKEGLPLGFQLMGARFSEEMLFALGKIFEKAINYKPKLAI